MNKTQSTRSKVGCMLNSHCTILIGSIVSDTHVYYDSIPFPYCLLHKNRIDTCISFHDCQTHNRRRLYY